jgi:NADPH2:quinone reductase
VKAVFYERTGPAAAVLQVGELPDPLPGPGEVRVRIAVAGVNPADVKRRAGAGDRRMTVPLAVPGDDGAGVIDAVGEGVMAGRVGERVWVHAATLARGGGQDSRARAARRAAAACGTCAELVVVPAAQAVPLPDGVELEVGACLGVPALTAHRALFADGPLGARRVLVTGGAGAVGQYAIQLAKRAGATVVATASTAAKQAAARAAGADHVVDYRRADAAEQVVAFAGPVERVIDVALGRNLPLTAAVIAPGATIAAYGSDEQPEPRLPFYPLMRNDATIRLITVFAMPPDALRAAVKDVNDAVEAGALTHPIAARFPLEATADAHEAVERGSVIGKTLVTVSKHAPG